MSEQKQQETNTTWQTIKYVLTLVGIIALTIIFWASGKNLKIKSLYKLILKNYEQRMLDNERTIKEIKENLEELENHVELAEEILEEIHEEQKAIKEKIEKLPNQELEEAIGEWFGTRK